MMSKHRKIFAALAWMAVAAPAAQADWLVTQEGARLETKGPWTVRGKLVVFTMPDGTLSSLRLEHVDLEASKRAEQEIRQDRERAAAPVEKPKRKSIVSLTDKDFAKAAPAVAASPEAEALANADPAAAPAAGAGTLEVVDWARSEDDGVRGIRLVGKVRNGTANQAAGVSVIAMLFDESGTMIGQVPAELDTNLLQAGESASFVVNSEDTFSFAGVKFQVRGAPMRSQPAPAAQPGSQP